VGEDRLDDFKAEHGVERSDLGASYLLLKAEEAIARGALEEAEKLGDKAARFSPASPIPHFFLFRLSWMKNKTDLHGMANHYLTAVRLTAADFWFLHSLIGTSIILLYSAMGLFFGTFLLYSFVSYIPLWIHQIREKSAGYFHPLSAGLFFSGILLVPLFLQFSVLWFIFFAFFLFWGFYSRAEKGIVFVFLTLMGTSLWVLPFLLNFFTAKESLLLNEMVRLQQGDYFFSPLRSDPQNRGENGLLIDAAYASQKGDYEQAEAVYQKILAEHPNSAFVLNNLGNIAFYQNQYSKAVDYYQRATKAAPTLVSAHYNMSLAYREMLSFEEGNAEYGIAKRLHPDKVEEYTRKSVLFPASPLVEERPSRLDLWRTALAPGINQERHAKEIWQGLAGKVPLRQAPFSALILLFILNLFSLFFEKRIYTASFCVICRRAVCKRCQKTILSYRVCGECGAQFKSIRKSDLVLLEAEERKIPQSLFPFLLLPGGGHLILKKGVFGFVFLILFFFSISYLSFGEVLFSSTHWHLQSGKWFWVPFSIAFLYLFSILDLIRIWSSRSWP
ncbi:MAG: tetratricopeptide repeat protein, partial [Candidatus Manganitrophaceae bacterium]